MTSIHHKAWGDDATQALRECLSKGMGIAEISRQLGIKYSRVRDRIRTLQRAKRHKPPEKHRNPTVHYKPRGVGQTWERKCLCCGGKFHAESPWLRLCPEDRAKG